MKQSEVQPIFLTLMLIAFAHDGFAIGTGNIGEQCSGNQTRTTTYSAHCAKDGQGGGGTSSGAGKIKDCGDPAQHPFIDNRIASASSSVGSESSTGNWVMVAIPQTGAPKGLKLGCKFHIKEYPGMVFKACDHYGEGSDGQNKVDISSRCEDITGGKRDEKGIGTGGTNPHIKDCGTIEEVDCSEAVANDSGSGTHTHGRHGITRKIP